jgi:hypothetical protein
MRRKHETFSAGEGPISPESAAITIAEVDRLRRRRHVELPNELMKIEAELGLVKDRSLRPESGRPPEPY